MSAKKIDLNKIDLNKIDITQSDINQLIKLYFKLKHFNYYRLSSPYIFLI